MGVKRRFNQPYTVAPSSGVLALADLENMSEAEKIRLVKAVANDMAATIIHIGKHIKTGNLTADQIRPLYNLLETVAVTQRSEWDKLKRELESCEKELEASDKSHKRYISVSTHAATAESGCSRGIYRMAKEDSNPEEGKEKAVENHPHEDYAVQRESAQEEAMGEKPVKERVKCPSSRGFT